MDDYEAFEVEDNEPWYDPEDCDFCYDSGIEPEPYWDEDQGSWVCNLCGRPM